MIQNRTQRKRLASVLALVLAAAMLLTLVGCGKDGDTPTPDDPTPAETAAAAPQNGGFESADLSGWTIEWGDAFDNSCVSSETTFTFASDAQHQRLSVDQTGNWYLTGKGFDGKYAGARTGSIRSTEFVMPSDGVISFKLAGGALTVGKGESAPDKDPTKLCYLAVYRASDDRMIARQTNDYFFEHTEDYVNAAKYASGAYSTDNFNLYTLSLKEYAGERVYLRIVDNDESYYYGYLAVDDIRVGASALPQTEGAAFTKVRLPSGEVSEVSPYEIVNGGFETGDLTGWTIIEGEAFSNDGVNTESVWWNENIPYRRDGNFHYGFYKPSATGVMRSSEFILGGSGYISFKLGGCANGGETYLRFLLKTENGEGKEVARFTNAKYRNFQFPYVQNGMHLLNMVQYYADFSQYLGETMYIEVVDRNPSSDDLGCLTLDSIKTYWEEKPVWYTSESYELTFDGDIMPESEYQVANGGFETGDLTGWTLSGEIGVVSDASGWWAENLPYNKRGTYLFTGIAHEGGTGTLTSSAFTVSPNGWITYLLGGGGNSALCYLSVVDAESGEELARYGNRFFHDAGIATINRGSNLANMILYRADLSAFAGRSVKLVVTDLATSDWGLVTCDSFRTYYASEDSVPTDAHLAVNLLDTGEENPYQVANGGFESGTLDGWTLTVTGGSGDGQIGGISFADSWWAECIDYNKDGDFFFSGWEGSESRTGTLTSSTFTIGGSGLITFKLGGGKNTDLCRVEIVDTVTGEVLAAYGNTLFSDANFDACKGIGTTEHPVDAASKGVYMANMVLYRADLSDYLGRTVVIRLVDNATGDWGLLFADSFVTYYENASDVPEGTVLAENLNATSTDE